MFLGCSKDSLDMFDVGSKHVLKDVSVVFRYASEMFETCFRNVSDFFGVNSFLQVFVPFFYRF